MAMGVKTTFKYLSHDLLLEIFKKLPVSCLCKFKRVCKLWNSIISDPQLVEPHYAESKSRSKLLFCLSDYLLDAGVGGAAAVIDLYSADYPQTQPPIDLTRTLTYIRRFVGCQPIWRSVHGLCLIDFHDFVRIWNLATSELFELITTGMRSNLDPNSYVKTYYLGYNPVKNKHKLVSIWLKKRSIRRRKKNDQTFVLYLEGNSWRSTELPPFHGIDDLSRANCIDGFMFFKGWHKIDGQDEKKCVLAYHLGSGRLDTILYPQGLNIDRAAIEFEGCLTLVDHEDFIRGLDGEEITMWTLKDLEQQIWSCKRCLIPWRDEDLAREDGLVFSITGSSPTGELMMAPLWLALENPSAMILYHVETNSLRRMELVDVREDLGEDENDMLANVSLHVDSLHSPDILSLQ